MAKIDLNSATKNSLIKLGGLSTASAKKIVALRNKAGMIASLETLGTQGILSDAEMKKVSERFYIGLPESEKPAAPFPPGLTEQPQATIRITARFDIAPKTTEMVLPGLYIRILYSLAGAGETAERFELNLAGTTVIDIDGIDLDRPLSAIVEGSQGETVLDLQEIKVRLILKAQKAVAEILVPWDKVSVWLKRTEPKKVDVLSRAGRFVDLHDPSRRFDGYRLFIDIADDEEKRNAVAALLGQPEGGAPNSGCVLLNTTDSTAVQRLSTFDFTGGELKFDGGFSFERALGTDVAGWVWVLSGQNVYAGYREEKDAKIPVRNVTVIVPSTPDQAKESAAQETGCGCASERVPYDVGEAQLLNRPDLFHDDPGTYCEPFTNPSRILGERRIFTVFRVGQPELRSTSPNTFLNFDLPNQPQWLSRMGGGKTGFLSAVNMFKRTGGVKNRRQAVSGNNPIDWDGDSTRYQALSVVGGHILEWRIQWRANGYSLGDVRYTLTLAPRQTKRILKLDWRRSEIARRKETTVSSDEVDQATLRDRDYSDAVASSLSEWSKGGSHSSTTGVAAGAGAVLGPVVLGGGASHGSSSSSSWIEGGRNATASEQQKLRDAIRQHGDSVRQMQSTVVVESEQSESVQGVSEIIRNPNYGHSLTVLYHEILRHFRVDTSLGGVRECLFVPFAIAPLTFERISRWRDIFEKRLLKRELRWAFKYTEEFKNNWKVQQTIDGKTVWVECDVPAGPRSEQKLAYLSGSLFIKLGIERPRDEEATTEIDDAVKAEGGRGYVREKFLVSTWQPYAPYLALAVSEAVSFIAAVSPRERETYFQRQMAPGMAARWVDRLQLNVKQGSRTVPLTGSDLTLASTYRFNDTVRVDFTIPTSTLESLGVTRSSVVEISVKPDPGTPLPPGSVANLLYGSIKFETAHYGREVHSDRGARDMVKPENGSADEAVLTFPLNAYEQRNIRNDVEQAFDDIERHVNDNLHHYHKAIWWHMDRDELYMLLDGFAVSEQDGRSIASVVEREPIGIMGNMLVFRVAAGAFIGVDGHKDSASLLNYYRAGAPVAEPMRVSIPTEGLYAQALMDKCVALEEHGGSLDWVLNDPDPALADFPAGLFDTRRAEPQAITPTQFPASIINLQNAPAAPDPTGLSSILNTVGKSDSFRDMAGLAGTQQNAAAAMQTAANLATSFGTQAASIKLADMAAKQQATTDADKKLASIERAKDKGLIDDAEASRQTAKVLENMHTPDASEKPQQNAAVDQLLKKASETPGSSVESRTAEGEVKVALGTPADAPAADAAAAPALPPQPLIVLTSPWDSQVRSFNPKLNDKTGTIPLKSSITNMPAGGKVEWRSPGGELQIANPADLATVITGLKPGLCNLDYSVKDSTGVTKASIRLPIAVPQFFEVKLNAAFGMHLMAMNLAHVKDAILERIKKVAEFLTTDCNIRLVWTFGPFNETLPTQLAVGGAAAAYLSSITIMGDPPAGKTEYGNTDPANTGNWGPATYNEGIELYPGGYAKLSPGFDVDDLTREVFAAIAALNSSDEVILGRAIDVYGRLIGETMAHEAMHSIIGLIVAAPANAHNAPVVAGDIMNPGGNRSFLDRTGIEITGANFITTGNFFDHGLGSINRPTGTALQKIRDNFPVPPAFI